MGGSTQAINIVPHLPEPEAAQERARCARCPHLAERPDRRAGQGTLTDRLVGSFVALVEQGQLGDELPPARESPSVARWVEQAGVPTETWAWIDSG
jgi:hypothetical protein